MPRTTRTQRTAEKRPRARPSWPDRFLEALPKYGTIAGTAKAINVGRRTVYDEMGRNPEFAADVHAIQDACVELVEATLYQQALDPDHTTDRIFYLKTAKPERYAERLNPQQIQQIKDEAKAEAVAEFNRELERLPDDLRRLIAQAWNRTKELTP